MNERHRTAAGGEAGPRHEYAVVDVFADQALAGNPLAVVTDADDLDAVRMAAIAVEFNLSETTFVSRPTLDGADFRLRSFTPGGEEVHGAGHNALGAWWWLARTGAASPPGANQELGGRVLPVQIGTDDGLITVGLDQGPVELGVAHVDSHELGAALSRGVRVCLSEDLPPVTGSVGSTHLLVALASMADVDAVEPDAPALAALLARTGAQGCYVYSVETEDPGPDAYCRFFNPTVGIAEDPATGSAAGPLAAHLSHLEVAGPRARFLQGRSMGRPSYLDVEVGSGATTLTGRCALAATGELQA